MEIPTELLILIAALLAGTIGTMVGLGGGTMLVPVLSVFLGVHLKTAIAASALSVVVNSLSGASVYIRHHIANVRLSLLMLITAAIGAIAGGLIVVFISTAILRLIFGLSLAGMAIAMMRRPPKASSVTSIPNEWNVRGRYYDPAVGREVEYTPVRVPHGMGFSVLAGIISGMLGIGGGAVQVPVMNQLMRIPVKAAAATSVLMVGATVVSSALIYYIHDLIDPSVAVPAVLGVLFGAQLGARLARIVPDSVLTRVLVLILGYLSITLILQSAGINLPGVQDE